jgi:predicted Zn-dependent protease
VPPARAAAPSGGAAAPPSAAPPTEPAATPAAGDGQAASAAPAGSTAPAALPAADRQRLARARTLMGEARRAGELAEAFALARAVAESHPASIEAQHLAAEIAYRASRWEDAVTYFRRGGEPVAAPPLMFYLAVALWESGDGDEAARVLERALPGLPRSAFVDGYVERILGHPR